MTPQEYLKIKHEQDCIILNAQRKTYKAREKADRCSWPKNTRPAEADDIKAEAVIWRKTKDFEGKEVLYWNIVAEPQHYGDPFKAYVADDGCRYGLDGAFIDTNPPSEFPLIKAVRSVLEP